MDDSFANPLRTGLMFVPLGPSVSSAVSGSLRHGDEFLDLEAAVERECSAAAAAPLSPRRAGLGRLLQRLRLIPDRHVPSST